MNQGLALTLWYSCTPQTGRNHLRESVLWENWEENEEPVLSSISSKITFCWEIALFNSTRPPSAEDKNVFYFHSVDEPDPEVAEINNVEIKLLMMVK